MGKNDKFRERKSPRYKREFKELEIKQGRKDPLIVLSFKNFDAHQGQSFEAWQKEALLARALKKLQTLCQYSIPQARAEGILKMYNQFPPSSSFHHPKHIPADIQWCSMHIGNKPCVIGYFEDNIFHIVFLDKEHEFWITPLKHT